jgi:phosphomannomutase
MIYHPSLFRPYDVRGTYPDQMNESVAYAAGQAFVHCLKASRVAVGRDVRLSGPSLQAAVIKGITDAGATALDLGIISTEMLYFASGALTCDGGITVTASHNPAQWNGLKVVGKGGIPLLKEGDLGKIYSFIQSGKILTASSKGSVEKVDLLSLYSDYLEQYTPKISGAPLKIVANANFGANGKVVDRVVKNLPVEIIRLNWQEDGSFPKGTPDPLLPRNRIEIEKTILKEGADFGVAWDADADRCFFYDNQGRFFHGYYITAFLIDHFLRVEPGASVVVERRLTWANTDAITKGKGNTVWSKTGHGYIKKQMRAYQAIFGGEVSGHYYYRDFYSCDNGLITFLTIVGIFAQHIANGGTVSDLLEKYVRQYPISPEELNYTTDRAREILEKVELAFPGAKVDREDGISLEFADWRCNLRMSSNEPLLRANIEAKTPVILKEKQTNLMQFLAAEGAVLRDDT